VAHLAPELPLQLRPLLLGLAADSLGFALVQETLGDMVEDMVEDTWKTFIDVLQIFFWHCLNLR
jgi:hypothetical protein